MSKKQEIVTAVDTANDIQKVEKVDEYQEMYLVLINQEEQYSLWPSYKPIPPGWKVVGGGERTESECLAYVDEVWTDMRPLSLRKKIEELQRVQVVGNDSVTKLD